MTTVARYNHTIKKFANGEVTLASLKFMLLDATASFTATDTTLDQVAGAASPSRAKEVFGNGWAEGGQSLAGAAWSTVTTDDAMLDASDISVTATPAAIGPASFGVITDGTLVYEFYDFEGAKTAGIGTPFNVTVNASGIAGITG